MQKHNLKLQNHISTTNYFGLMFLVMNQLHDVQKAYWHDNHKPIYFAL